MERGIPALAGRTVPSLEAPGNDGPADEVDRSAA